METWETNRCMLYDFSASYNTKHNVAGFVDPEAKIVLQPVAQSLNMDIADAERPVVGRPLAKRQQRAAGRGVVSVVAARTTRSEGSNFNKRRAVRPARATLVSEHFAGKKADFRKLGGTYRHITAEDPGFQARGSLVAKAHAPAHANYLYVHIMSVLCFVLSMSIFLWYCLGVSQNHVYVFFDLFFQFPERDTSPELR